jgi:lysophospholipid acyltransferase (LPLAT)-like uncharacterized protein
MLNVPALFDFPMSTTASQTPAARGVVVPEKATFGLRLAALLLVILIRTTAATLRYKWIDRSGFYDSPPAKPAIYALWHSKLWLGMKLYFGYAKKRSNTPGFMVMVSASKDGGFLTEIFKRFGVHAVRGSTSRRGQQALLELTRLARRGYDLGITPDGPRGPSRVAQDGVIYLAQLTGLPIIPHSFHVKWKYRLKSWDRLQIPIPFSRCEMYFAKPIYVPRDTTPEQRETLRQQLEDALNEISPD